MSGPYRAVRITDDVYWVGAIDWNIRDFHGYATSRGTTYNAYLLMGEKTILMDTVKEPFRDEMLSRISSVVDPGRIDIIISNHSEMDHSGCLPQMIDMVKPEKVYASAMGVKALLSHFGFAPGVISPVKDGESLRLGSHQIDFLWTRMLHWPDSMFSYMPDKKLLFSQDAFGMHLAGGERFACQIDPGVLEWEAAKYYANILLPFSPFVKKLLEKVKKVGIEPAMILPDHGPMYQTPEKISWIFDRYRRWSSAPCSDKVVVVYDTMWKATEEMARAIAQGASEEGSPVKVLSMGASHRSDVATELMDAGAVVAGSPTLNRNLFPTMADVLTYIQGLKPQNLLGASFGAYGWSGEGPDQVRDYVAGIAEKMVGDTIKVQYKPDGESLEACRHLGAQVAVRLRERMKISREAHEACKG